MKIYQTIKAEENNKVCTLWLNRPELHNAMNDIMIAELTEVFQTYPDKKDIRLIVLRGKGKSFCAGADLNYMKKIAGYDPDENLKDSIKLAQLFSTIYECKLPTIAVVQGACLGGANGLIAACDMVIAGSNTVFAFSEVKIGLAPATISPFVIRRIGEYGAKELMITGKPFHCEEAIKWNLINHSFAENKLELELQKIAESILCSGPRAVRATKELIGKVVQDHHNMIDTLGYTSRKISELRASKEGQEGMASFLEKRKPDWSTE